MAFNRKEHKDAAEEKVIEINAQMEGTLTFSDPVNLKIQGRYTGKLDARGTLTIGPTSQVEANIIGENVIVAGKIKGNIVAKKMLVLMPSAVVHGDISTPKLNIVEGAIFQGHCHMLEDILSIDDLAQYLEIEIPAIVELATTGKIPAIKEGDGWKFERSQIEQWALVSRVKS
ncbi:MAG: polymer-forming cytoskeletal protein [Candidatus Omnitrophica bacterium]|nr:polymer-forming cytoskeletal protein [Candidatus Omnitrophota bacterium]MDE2008811.1 polymer-forming cytoskeletal protein [Candidatus Omnitrophota bacterium]MDE2213626.1 polymer-forming cytoskeletal protein [Candidatus Omnitrophota bacterium]MDE2230473.1 polymer-forming cytoskeletal protein [Candidatus Omnitrophota bacterium]